MSQASQQQRQPKRAAPASRPGPTPPGQGAGGGGDPGGSPPGKKGGNLPLIGAALAAVVAAVVVFGNFLPSSGDGEDQLTDQQRQEMNQGFQRFQAGAGAGSLTFVTPVNLNDPGERQRVEEALQLPQAQKQQLIEQAVAQQIQLGWITVWDNYAEDGDVLEVSANGVSQRVPIWNAPTTIVVPYTGPGAQVTITGAVDGGGGITAAARTSAGDMPFPPLTVGQSRTLSIR